jgi:hypothetical protein
MIYLVVFLRMVNMGVQVEICARKVIWRVNNNRKIVNFCDFYIIIFLQRIFEALNRIFRLLKNHENRVFQGTLCLCSSNKRY